MIVPMKRLTLLASAKAQSSALEALRALGCVHVTLEVRDGEAIRRAAAAVAASEQALRVLDVAEKKGTFAFRPEASSPVAMMTFEDLVGVAKDLSAPETTEAVNRAAELITRLREEAFTLSLELRRYAPFGAIDPDTVSALATAGHPVQLFKAPLTLDTLPANAFLFGTDAGQVYGAWIASEPLPDGVEVLPMPKLSTATMQARVQEAQALAEALVQQLAVAATSVRPALSRERATRLAERTVADVSANLHTEGAIAYLQGYLPVRATDAVLAKAQSEGWGVVLNEPDEGDPNVPVLLEPPRGFRAIGTLFKGLGILPGYSEGDCSVPFYLFFSLFFAMLVGDAGYGAVMLTGVLFAGWKLWKQPAARPVLLILTVFCASTIVWGVLSGTYFGINKAALPACLTQLPTVGWLSDDNNLMFLCFLIGAVHISVARLWNATLLAPNIKMLGELGWLGVTWSMFLIVCGIVVSWFAQPAWTWWLLGGSVVVILVPLISDIKNEGINIGMLPLNVISAMGDIISYVRLFAVGLASVKVAENFNAMALGLDLPVVLRILAVCAILLVGHGLNLAMGALSILVHAVRLNTLEFSNAKGITWSGQPYTPFQHPQQ